QVALVIILIGGGRAALIRMRERQAVLGIPGGSLGGAVGMGDFSEIAPLVVFAISDPTSGILVLAVFDIEQTGPTIRTGVTAISIIHLILRVAGIIRPFLARAGT